MSKMTFEAWLVLKGIEADRQHQKEELERINLAKELLSQYKREMEK